MPTPPSGTVTFLFTDIEGSTAIAREYPQQWETLRARHHALLYQAVQAWDGYVFQIIGDAFCVAFHTAVDAINAAVDAQRLLQQEDWCPVPLRVRMGINSGVAQASRDQISGGYTGYTTLARVQRVMSTANGGQILLSNASAELARGELPESVSLRDMGENRLKGLLNPERLWQVLAPGLEQDFPTLQTLNAIPNNLPIQVTSFVGRENEIVAIRGSLETARLLTLTGPGGTGKTRLSLQVAAEALDAFKDGAWFIELASLSDPRLVTSAIASVLSVREEAGRPLEATLLEWLSSKQVLLILDNCEHLVEACARFADAAIHAGRDLHILATSREALGIAGETVYRVPSLEFPTPERARLADVEQLAQYAAVRLFIDRAVQALASFGVTNQNAPALAQICYRLDGIPLAIELAAVRVKALSLEQIAARLDDRFRLLTTGSRTALPRQQTLHAMIDWSYELLSAPERLLFQRLGVFTGGWSLEAAEVVCAEGPVEAWDVLDLLTHLVDKSLATAETRSGEARYNFLETIRDYAHQALITSNAQSAFQQRHLAYYLDLVERAGIELHSRAQRKWLARLEAEHDNLRAALEWSLQNQPEASLRMCAVLADFWDTHGYVTEGRRWIERSLAATQEHPPSEARVKALYGGCELAIRQSDVPAGRILLAEALTTSQRLDYKRGLALGISFTALFGEHFEDPHNAWELQDQALALWRELGDKLGIGQAIGPIAGRASSQGNYRLAEQLYGESLGLFREVGDEKEIAGALYNLADVAILQGDNTGARALASESLAIYRELEDKHGVATMLRTLGEAAENPATDPQVESQFQEGIRIFRELGDWGCMAITLCSLGWVYLLQGDAPKASALAEESLEETRRMNYRSEMARPLELLGWSALAQGQPLAAQQFFSEALGIRNESGERLSMASLLEGLASAWNGHGFSEKAVRFYGAASAFREKNQSPPSPYQHSLVEGELAALRETLGENAFAAAWTSGRAMPLEQVVELALGSAERAG